jgi:hypothetical protein
MAFGPTGPHPHSSLWGRHWQHCWGLRPTGYRAHALGLLVAFLSHDMLLFSDLVSPVPGTREETELGKVPIWL